jgi:mRNA-degrading endonuclease RelE of RelBE toxin-antitoxin system
MKFVETAVFTRIVKSALPDDDYRTLQTVLLLRPEQGALIPGTGGLRKIRWAGKGHGKRGGYRLIYYWERNSETFYMLYMYPKNEQEDLTDRQAKLLGQLVRKEFK